LITKTLKKLHKIKIKVLKVVTVKKYFGILHHEHWYKFTDISEENAVPIFSVVKMGGIMPL